MGMDRADDIPASPSPPPAALRRGWVLWPVMLVGWTAYGLLYAYQAVEWHIESGQPYSWPDELRTNLVGMWGWVPLATWQRSSLALGFPRWSTSPWAIESSA